MDRYTITYERDCDCVGASASGPRTTMNTITTREGIRTVFTFVRVACDVCDRPWVRRDIEKVALRVDPPKQKEGK